MCEIIWAIPKKGNNVFRDALDTLVYKRPDNYGLESMGNDITLGHRRLSIIDIDHGHQPILIKKNCTKTLRSQND